MRPGLHPILSMWATAWNAIRLAKHRFLRDTSNPLSPHLPARLIRIADIERPAPRRRL